MTYSRSKGARPLHVCMLMPSFYPVVGGMETQVENLIPFLRECGIETTVVTRGYNRAPRSEVRQGVRILRMPVAGGAGLRSISYTTLGTLHTVRSWQTYDILHAHSIMSPTTIAAIAGLVTRTPRVVTLHATFEPERLLTKPLGAARLHWYGRHIDRFVAINADITTFLHGQLVPNSRIVAIPNGIDTSRFRPATDAERCALRTKLNLPLERPVALFVGRLDPVKQVDVLLRAWRSVTNAALIILGDGEERTSLELLARSEGIEESISFRGMVTNVDEYLRAADVFVLPSRSEGLSVAMLEAMASGCVPIATAVGGAVELIAPGQNGLLVTPGDVEELGAALQRGLSHDTWRSAAAHQSSATVRTRYDLRVIASELAALYRTLVPDR